jgi:predicted DNA-binding WGR domain protein
VETTGSKQKLRFGTFEEKEKVVEDDDEARENSDKKIQEKLSKGFKEVTAGGGASAAKKKSPFEDEDDEEDAPAPAAKKAAPAPSAPAAAAPAKSSKGSEDGKRYFEFVEGTSSKFWEIKVEGNQFFTRYGKIGTDGQMTQKDWPSNDKAQAEADKLIAEKTRKGYVEK